MSFFIYGDKILIESSGNMRKGFTLIELLAVIVILAIIALIAVPIVLHIIEDSKKSSQEESIKMYGKAIEDAVANYLLINPNDKDITLAKIEKYINYSGERVECTDTKIYPNGKIYLGKCSVGGTEVTYTYGEKEKTLCTLVKKNGNEDINPGDEYTCEVIKGMEEPYTFYVLGTEGTGKNQKVNLIMDSNICGSATDENASTNGQLATNGNPCLIAWHSGANNNNYGPDTAMKGLYNATKNWTNVPDMDLSGENAYTDENNKTNNTKGYTGITTENGVATITGKNNATNTTIGTSEKPLKARLPREDEVTSENAGCHVWSSDSDYGTCNYWLVKNLYYDTGFSGYCSACVSKYSNNQNNGITNIKGYWLLSSNPGYSVSARGVYYNGLVNYISANNAGYSGVRAVITVSKSDLSS